MDKKDYTIINNAKNTIPEFGDTFEKCKKEHYKTLSIASHELLNHISFLNSSYDLISKTYPETKNMRFLNSMGTSIYEITKHDETLKSLPVLHFSQQRKCNA